MYAKLFTSIYQGTLRGNSHGLLVFTNLLAHCDKDGLVDIHPRAIAEEVGLTLDQVRAALDELEAPDEESRSPDEGGRRIVRLDQHRAWGWRVVNYLKYRAIRNEEDRREQNRLAQEKWRQRQKSASASVSHDKPTSAEVSRGKLQSAHTEAEAEAEAEADARNTNTQPRKRGAAARLVSVESLIADGVEAQHAADWLACRKAKSLPLTVTAWEKTKAEAAKAGITPAQAIKEAAGHGWGGFRASWLANAQAGNSASSGSKPIVNKQIAIEDENLRVAAIWSASRGGQHAA